MVDSLSRNAQKDILTKLDVIINQNNQIIKDNKILNEQYVNLIQYNNELELTIKKSEMTIQALQSQINKVLENGEKIQIKTNSIDEKVSFNDKTNIHFNGPNPRIEQNTPERHTTYLITLTCK